MVEAELCSDSDTALLFSLSPAPAGNPKLHVLLVILIHYSEDKFMNGHTTSM